MHCSFQTSTEFHRYHPINLVFSYPTDISDIAIDFPYIRIYIYIIQRYPINSIGYGYLWEISINSINSISKIPHRWSVHLHDLFDLCCARRQFVPWRDHRNGHGFCGKSMGISMGNLWDIYGISVGHIRGTYPWDIQLEIGKNNWEYSINC